MPLRAKITNPAFAGRAEMSTRYSRAGSTQRPRDQQLVIEELPEDDPEDVLFDTLFGVRTIELNKQSTLNSLNGSMARKIVSRLQEWAKSDMANVIIIKGAGRAFCAGGDVKHLAQDNAKGEEGMQRSTDYFALEYRLDHLIATYSKPYVAFMDGITMGGGVGLSIHAPFRIATERTVFAMPETTIGFFPDVGASFFLPRMSGGVGTYLALTSERLKGVNAFYAGIATHYIHSTSLPALERRLAELRFKDFDQPLERLQLIDSTIEEFCTGLPHDEPMLLKGSLREAIDRVFTNTSVPAIIRALEAEEGETEKWAQNTLKMLRQRSPTSVYVTLRQMQLGKQWDIRETFQREHSIAAKFMRHPDFTEGVTSLLIRKDKPKWQPASLKDVKDDIASPFFAMESDSRLELLSNNTYQEYPHSQFGLPTEGQVEAAVREVPGGSQKVVQHFMKERKGKQGVREVVEEILARKTKVRTDGGLSWIRGSGAEERKPEQPSKTEDAPETASTMEDLKPAEEASKAES